MSVLSANKNKLGFTLMELLVVIAIVAILLTISVIYFGNASQKKRDTQRISDITQIQNALEMYFRYESRYPDSLTFGGTLIGSTTSSTTYLRRIPQNPSPRNEGTCLNAEYSYASLNNGQDYQLSFCLANDTSNLLAGLKCVTASGISTTSCE